MARIVPTAPASLAALVALLAVPVPAAHAHPGHHYDGGGCYFVTVSDGSDHAGTTWTGEAHVSVVATDADGIPSPLTPISVECVVYVDGVELGTAVTASGTGAAAGAATFTFQADPDSVVDMCDVVRVGGEEHVDCGGTSGGPIIPWPLIDLINRVLDTVPPWLWALPDATLCPVLGSTAPGVPGVVDVTPQGDVSVSGDVVWDCPPYGDPPAASGSAS